MGLRRPVLIFQNTRGKGGEEAPDGVIDVQLLARGVHLP